MAAKTFIENLGGPAALGRELGVPLTTIVGWVERDKIPHWRLPALISLALAKKVAVPADLAA